MSAADAGEDWLVYHANTVVKNGWDDREVRAQPFGWDARGWPVFGEPVDPAVPIAYSMPANALASAEIDLPRAEAPSMSAPDEAVLTVTLRG